MESLIFRILIFVISVILFSIGIILSFYDKSIKVIVTTYSVAIFCLIFVFLPEFKKFKGFGFEAELLDKKIKEADQIIQKLRDLSVPIAETQIMTLSRMGRWGAHFSIRERSELVKKIEKELRAIGVSNEQLETVKKEWYLYNLFDIASPIRDFLNKYLSENINKRYTQIDERERYVNFKDNLLSFFQFDKIDNDLPNKIENELKDTSVLTESEKEFIFKKIKNDMDALRYYIKNKDFREPKKYFEKSENN